MPDSLYTKRALIIITNGVKPQAETLLADVDPTSTPPIFKRGLSASGSLPATHWVCSWAMTQAEWNSVQQKIGNVQNAWVYDAAVWTFAQAIADRGLRGLSAPMT